MFPIIPSNGAVTGFQIANSLRFRSSASAYLNRTPASAGNRQVWTWSGWIKRGSLGSAQIVMDCDGGTTDQTFGLFGFTASNTFEFIAYTTIWRVTTQVFRDPSSWYHLVLAFDTTQAVATNRIKFYVNGVQVTAFSTSNDPTQNTSYAINQAAAHYIARSYGGRGYFDGYLAEVNFIDGQALTPSSFGETDAVTGVWKPKRYSGTYGANGFRLNFSNGTSTTTLGNDSSGNGNNWTTNNISLTAGSTYDWMIDSPTPYPGSSYGVGNYCVLSPIDTTGGLTVDQANLHVSSTVAQTGGSRGTIGVSSGKWYWEMTANVTTTGIIQVGIAGTTAVNQVNPTPVYGVYINFSGNFQNQSANSAYGATFTTGDVIGIALNLDAGTLTFYKNNVSQGTAATGLTGSYSPWIQDGGGDRAMDAFFNFGQRPFAYTPPSGYKTLCTQNLPVVTIYNGAQYMAATTYTGTGSTVSIANTVNGVSFQPDFVWIKSRSSASWSNILQDTVRGITEFLVSNSTGAAGTTSPNIVNAVTSNGFQLLSNGNSNNNGDTYIAWQWKAGGTAVTNTAGSITSQVSANATAGFSVATFTCNAGGSGTFGHGLGVAPSMVIIKSRTSAIQNWVVGHTSIAWTNYLLLNQTGASSANATVWNNTAPSSTVVTLGSGFTSAAYGDCVAYCFAAIAGYSAFGSYTGNGSSDGPFVYCGFRPRWVMIKASSVTENWIMLDTSRPGYNPASGILYANLSNAEASSDRLDFVSNGFKVRATSAQIPNTSGATYIYAAFAENPLNVSLAR